MLDVLRKIRRIVSFIRCFIPLNYAQIYWPGTSFWHSTDLPELGVNIPLGFNVVSEAQFNG